MYHGLQVLRGKPGPIHKPGPALLTLLTMVAAVARSLGASPELLDAVKAEAGWIQAARHQLHQIPELAYKEEKTSAFVRSKLDELDISYQYPIAETGIVAKIGQGSPKFALRADMDALPVLEETELPFKSKTDGQMHACGHDAHMAMLLGAAKVLKAQERSLPGTVLLLFQPAEEGGRGAKRFVEAGVLEGVSGVHGIHVWPELESGYITTRVGAIMAAGDRVGIVVTGTGGHGALPHLATDSVVASAAVITALQSLISRETSATDSAVLSITQIHSDPGQANVIPRSVTLAGTMRALSLPTLAHLRKRITEVSELTAQSYGCTAKVQFSGSQGRPVVNSQQVFDLVKATAEKLQPKSFQYLDNASLTSEDFCYLADTVPGTFTFLGVRNESIGAVHGLHTPKFRVDDDQLPLGAALQAGVALSFFDQHKQNGWHNEL